MTDRPRPALVGVGGFLGAIARHLVGVAVAGPPGTLVANVVGSFALAFAAGVVRSERLRVLLTTGLLSSFTTYSTFAVETTRLGPTLGAVNVAITYGLGFAAAALGLVAGRRWA